MNGSWEVYLASPADFAGMDDIVPNLAKEREPGIKIIKHTPYSFQIITIHNYMYKVPFNDASSLESKDSSS